MNPALLHQRHGGRQQQCPGEGNRRQVVSGAQREAEPVPQVTQRSTKADGALEPRPTVGNQPEARIPLARLLRAETLKLTELEDWALANVTR